MSWDVRIDYPPCPTCGHERPVELDHDNYTHNCNEMLRVALRATGTLLDRLGDRHLYALDGKLCAEIGLELKAATDWWRDHLEELRELNPENGWGDADSALVFWACIADACIAHPRAKLSLWG